MLPIYFITQGGKCILKKVFLDSLPRWGDGRYKGKINWKECIGHKIEFIYNETQGVLDIIGYIYPNVTVIYKKNEYRLPTYSLQDCKLGTIVGEYKSKYTYSIGEIITTKTSRVKILKQLRLCQGERGYEYQCLSEGYIGTINEYDLKRKIGCPVCSNKKIIKGINDIGTSNPELLKYFTNVEDSGKYSRRSDVYLDFKCPDCGYEKNIQIKTLTKHSGFVCPQCGDGKSYPEKFILSFLRQLGANFIAEYKPKWIAPKRYDFYLPDYNVIIEAHGEQHYTNSFKIKNAKTLSEEIKNDEYKYKMALKNGISKNDYVVIDARHGECEWIKNSIAKSILNDKFDISNINWAECNEFAMCSIVREVCDIYNSGTKDTNKIADIVKIHRSTVGRYLNKGFKLGWCDYSGQKVKEASMRKVICLNNLKVFQSVNEASRYISRTSGAIHIHLRGGTKSAGKHPETGEKLRWMYYKDYIKFTTE